MKLSLLFYSSAFIILLSASSCKLSAPTFKTVENLKFERIGTRGLKLGADAVFYNPNRLKCSIKDIEVNVLINSKLVGVLGEKDDILIAKRSDFKIPLGISIKPEGSILDDLKTVWGIFTNKEADLSLVGQIKVKVLGITFPVPIKHQQKFNLGAIK